MGYNLLINRVYWGYNPLTNLLLTSWDIQVGVFFFEKRPIFLELTFVELVIFVVFTFY